MEHDYRVAARIHMSAVRHNLALVRDSLGKGVRLCAVLKTDAYGHGAVALAKGAGEFIDWIAVATVEEALELRENGIEKPVLILGYAHESSFRTILSQDIRPTVYSPGAAKKLSDAAIDLGTVAKIHIKLDTGMSRLGFPVREGAVEEICGIAALPGIEMEGIFTHFTSADEKDKTKTKKQLEKFAWMLSRLGEKGVRFQIRHCANSAGIMEGFGKQFDMVRAGIIVYGLYPSNEVEKRSWPFWPVLELKSHIVHLKTLEKGIGVSYGSAFVTERETKVATVPVGYGDGYPRLLSNKGEVLIRGKRAKILGRVCMDQFMADVTEIEGVSLGDEVTLIGRDGGEEILADDIASLCGTINYEIVCGLGKRIPRVYLKE